MTRCNGRGILISIHELALLYFGQPLAGTVYRLDDLHAAAALPAALGIFTPSAIRVEFAGGSAAVKSTVLTADFSEEYLNLVRLERDGSRYKFLNHKNMSGIELEKLHALARHEGTHRLSLAVCAWRHAADVRAGIGPVELSRSPFTAAAGYADQDLVRELFS